MELVFLDFGGDSERGGSRPSTLPEGRPILDFGVGVHVKAAAGGLASRAQRQGPKRVVESSAAPWYSCSSTHLGVSQN